MLRLVLVSAISQPIRAASMDLAGHVDQSPVVWSRVRIGTLSGWLTFMQPNLAQDSEHSLTCAVTGTAE